MRAIVQDGYGSADALHLREMDAPAPADDEVLVRVRASSVNAADCHLIHMPRLVRSAMGRGRPARPVPGADLAGVVEAAGAGVTLLKPGDEVFGVGAGSFAEFASCKEGRLAPKPPGLSFEQAATLPVAGVTALQGLRDKACLQAGQRVLIYGAGGGVGTFAVQIAKALGAQVTAATGPRNLEVVRAIGPDEVVDYTREDVTRRRGAYDVFFDVAATQPLRDCRRALAPNGTFVGVGAAKGGMPTILGRLLGAMVLARVGGQRMVSFMARVHRGDLLALSALVETGRVTPVIDRAYALDEVPDAIRYVSSGQARAKVVIKVS